MKFTVRVEETSYGFVTVEASSIDEAHEKAEKAYYDGNVFWNDSDFSVLSAREEKDRGDAR